MIMVERILMTIRPLLHIYKSANLHFVLLILFLLSVVKLRGQWISSTGIDGAVVSDLVALDSSLFIRASNSGVYERNVSGGIWEQKSSVLVSKIDKCKNVLFAWGFTSYFVLLIMA
jgi:hypothetical protein